MSSYTSKTYIVFLDLPKGVASKVDQIRSKYSSSYKKYPAHITLKQDEDYLITADEISRLVDEHLGNYQPLKIKLNKPKVNFSQEGWNIYFPVESNELKIIIKELSQKLEEFIDPQSPRAFLSTRWEQSDQFYTHVSIKGGSLDTDPTDLLDEIRQNSLILNLPLNFNCRTITIAQWQVDHWKKIKSIQLKYVK